MQEAGIRESRASRGGASQAGQARPDHYSKRLPGAAYRSLSGDGEKPRFRWLPPFPVDARFFGGRPLFRRVPGASETRPGQGMAPPVAVAGEIQYLSIPRYR
jgi:hypothetical protein